MTKAFYIGLGLLLLAIFLTVCAMNVSGYLIQSHTDYMVVRQSFFTQATVCFVGSAVIFASATLVEKETTIEKSPS